MKLLTVAFALLPLGAMAQMIDEPTCYTWQGGNFSAGAFTKCTPPWIIVKEQPKVAALPPPPAPSPVMMPMQSCPPVAKPKHHIIKRKPRVQC